RGDVGGKVEEPDHHRHVDDATADAEQAGDEADEKAQTYAGRQVVPVEVGVAGAVGDHPCRLPPAGTAFDDPGLGTDGEEESDGNEDAREDEVAGAAGEEAGRERAGDG